jgi:hypothetical protein
MMDIRCEYGKKSVREKAEEVQLFKVLTGDVIRQMRLTDPVEINKYLADAAAGDLDKYSPISGYAKTGIRDPFNSPITPQNRCHFCDYKPPPRDSKKLLRCSACKAVKYCDRDCQSKDWKFHKKGCALIQSDPKGLGDKMIAST